MRGHGVVWPILPALGAGNPGSNLGGLIPCALVRDIMESIPVTRKIVDQLNSLRKDGESVEDALSRVMNSHTRTSFDIGQEIRRLK